MNQMRVLRTLVDDLPDPGQKILKLLDAWRAARKGELVPLKRDFDPLTVAPLLSRLWLYGLEEDGADFVCRLAGEDVNITWGRSIAGEAAKSIFGPEDHTVIVGIWHAVLNTPLIHYGKAEKMQANAPYAAERIVLPLRAVEGDPVKGYVLGMSLYAFTDLQKARPERILTNAFHVNCADIT